jgi:hypothetical protein
LFEAQAKIAGVERRIQRRAAAQQLGIFAPQESRVELRLRSPTAPYAPRLEDLVESKVMSSGDFDVE